MSPARKQLPTKKDFDATTGCLDAIEAWKNFGGLTLDEAYEKFCQAPETYQEDFMFMGWAAFTYYLPVVERYLRETTLDPNETYEPYEQAEVESIWILAHCLEMQIASPDLPGREAIRLRLLDLANHIRANLSSYAADLDRQQEVDAAWKLLEKRAAR